MAGEVDMQMGQKAKMGTAVNAIRSQNYEDKTAVFQSAIINEKNRINHKVCRKLLPLYRGFNFLVGSAQSNSISMSI